MANALSLAAPIADALPASGASVLGGAKTMAEMEKASKDFEAVFMAQMLKPMWDGLGTDSAFGGGRGEEVMRDMLVQEYGKSMAKADDFGLSHAVLNEMIRMQQQTSGGSVRAG